ncbi:MAG: ATP-binding protein [Prolixibacteraceae bacterium]|jgi:signal transduction histidine kinase|nr:ATP-binding protein [Prolixibacteraceae bacterium]
MPITPIQKDTSILRPRARIIKTIGEELISDDKVALLELVKNSYDADASIITIKISGHVVIVKDGKNELRKITKEGGSITIYDDGCGMSLDIIKKAWMEPATISKKIIKNSSTKGRRYTGEKGIGRFASAKLSSDLKIISKVVNDNEVVVKFDWRDFDNYDLYLDEVKCNWEVREPIEFTANSHGTKLILTNLHSDWDEEKIRQFRIALQRLINPVSPVLDFLIELDLPKEFDSYSGTIEPPESLKRPNYSIKGTIDKNGIPSVTFTSKKNGESKLTDFVLLKKDENFLTGSFDFDFRVWDLDIESLDELAKETDTKRKYIRDALKEIAGISIYRDGFRVLPYGDPKFDWARLDIRRVNNPTLRISNNQIIGFISIELDKNPEFKDQSNREGLVESNAFSQLKDFITRILNQLEIKRYEERPRANESSENREGLFTRFSLAPVTQLVQTKLPNDKEANELIAKTEANIQVGIKKIQEVLSRYRRLSTLGMLIDIILHDGNNFLANVDSSVHLLEKELAKNEIDKKEVTEYLNNINEGRKVLAQLFKRIEPFGGRKRGRPKDIVLEDAITNVFALYKNRLTKLNIGYDLPESRNQVKIDDGELQMIFVNLIQNSIYWLETIESERKIQVEVIKTDDELSAIFSDSGPGVKEEHHQLIFDPYFSTRPDGIGLGLTIIGELVTEYDGDFSLIDNGPLDGATFKITFRRRI